MEIVLVAGARPDFMKLAPIVRVARQRSDVRVECHLVYTGVEGDCALEPTLFDDLCIARPERFLGIDSANQSEQTARAMVAFDGYLQKLTAGGVTLRDVFVVVADELATTMGCAIVTKKRGARLASLVAGTRSFDINMPKEINRLVIDGLSDLLFTAGVAADSIVSREGGSMENVYMVGNILIDTLRTNRGRWRRPACLGDVVDGQYVVLTVNRPALLDDEEQLCSLTTAIRSAVGRVRVVVPTRSVALVRAVEAADDAADARRTFIVQPTMDMLEFGYLTAHARGIVTDSSNIAEEATFSGVPCITLGSYTEHVETVKVGSNELAGDDLGALSGMLGRMIGGEWKQSAIPERWDGRSAERVLNIMLSKTM